MKKYVQLYLGGPGGRAVSEEAMRAALDPMERAESFAGVIAGWTVRPEPYRWLRRFTRERGLKLYLWLPVLSEFGELRPFRGVEGFGGKPLGGARFDGDETFDFCCPTRRDTGRFLLEIYEEQFAWAEFDGVFLDRIRFPAPSAGPQALFSCLCPACREAYGAAGLTEEMLRACRDRLRAEEKPLGIESRREGRYRFADPAFAAYLDCRAGLVTALAGRLADWFHGRGLAVGLDLFSPLLAPFVGQDYGALSKKADFVKPMLYRYTATPAGIFYELRGIARAFAPAGREEAYFRALCEAAGARPEEGGGACYSAELAAARALCACEVLAGMELHTVPGRPPVTAGQVGDSVRRAARGGAAGAVASWNLLAAPEETVRAFAEMPKEK